MRSDVGRVLKTVVSKMVKNAPRKGTNNGRKLGGRGDKEGTSAMEDSTCPL